jgi:hypothetical protein
MSGVNRVMITLYLYGNGRIFMMKIKKLMVINVKGLVLTAVLLIGFISIVSAIKAIAGGITEEDAALIPPQFREEGYGLPTGLETNIEIQPVRTNKNAVDEDSAIEEGPATEEVDFDCRDIINKDDIRCRVRIPILVPGITGQTNDDPSPRLIR